jgi:sugar/nucleoside kinase (ribokinase family)
LETDTGKQYYTSDGTTWTEYAGADVTETLTNKTLNATNNTITDSSTAAGDVLKSNGTKFVRLARGSAFQVLAVNSGGTDLAYTTLPAEQTGKATASGDGSTTAFTIAHSVGSTPSVVFVQCSTFSTSYTYTVDATNITVTFTTAPTSGSSNVIFYWRAVA